MQDENSEYTWDDEIRDLIEAAEIASENVEPENVEPEIG
jgi:hypothetical protein